MDRILIRDLLLRCIIGINPDERREKQDIVISIELAADLSKAAESDSFADAVDYRALKKEIIAMVEGSEFHLLEALASHIARLCLSSSPVEAVKVTVDKPGALRFARSVGVEITRERTPRPCLKSS
jgi:D-erythro-7,8-dihydroneopterin triphosphate epimerase